MFLEEGVCYDQCILLAKRLVFDLVHFVLQGQICVLLQVALDFYFCIPVPYNKEDIFLGLVPEGPIGLHRTVQLLQHYWSGHRLGLL